jgi:hypothetical protein
VSDTIEIRCTQDHPEQPRRVANAYLSSGVTGDYWLGRSAGTSGEVVSEHIFEHDGDPAPSDGQRVRVRWNLRCPLCGYALAARGERIDRVLDKLRHAGIATIELRHLATILG